MTATRTRPRAHLIAVTLRARSRKALISARMSRLLSQARAVGERFTTAPHTTAELDLLVRRRLMGDMAYRLAVAVEGALEISPGLEESLEGLNGIGVNHNATAQELAIEARALTRHAQDITQMANNSPHLAMALNRAAETGVVMAH